MIRLMIAGAAGKMGLEIARLALADPGLSVSCALERQGAEFLGADLGLLAGKGVTDIKISSDPAPFFASTDVIIDFTNPVSTLELIRKKGDWQGAVVIGTTGFNPAQTTDLHGLLKKNPTVISPNMSVGVNVPFSLVEKGARILNEDYDIEIVEAHHRNKKDSPSGTAAKLAEIIARTLGRDLEKDGIYGRKGMVGARKSSEIGVHAVRAGDIVGDHNVMFAGNGERIELIHRAHSRVPLAVGTIKAAKFLHKKAPGFYTMLDVLNITG